MRDDNRHFNESQKIDTKFRGMNLTHLEASCHSSTRTRDPQATPSAILIVSVDLQKMITDMRGTSPRHHHYTKKDPRRHLLGRLFSSSSRRVTSLNSNHDDVPTLSAPPTSSLIKTESIHDHHPTTPAGN